MLGPVGAAVGVYAGIRADLAALRVTAAYAARSADAAHRRLDDCMRGGCHARERHEQD